MNDHLDEDLFGDKIDPSAKASTLHGRFLIPPFTTINTRDGTWQERKRGWMALGIKGEEGRDATCLPDKKTPDYMGGRGNDSGISVFDPTLCEVLYTWFAPNGGVIFDTFAGGSVRGIVAGTLGFHYLGLELRGEQVEANRVQGDEILKYTPPEYTPIEEHGGILKIKVKRDDLFAVAGVAGGKARSAFHLAQGAPGLVTAGSRQSPQVKIVAHIAKHLGIPCRVHTPTGDKTPELLSAEAMGAELVQHKPGYNSVIIARAREDAEAKGWRNIPFGMQCKEAPEQTAKQVENIPQDTKRIVIPVGSGMSLAGVLWGLKERLFSIPVLGVVVGADPTKRLDEYAPEDWRDMVELVPAQQDYHEEAETTKLWHLELDPIYEGKCFPFLTAGDLLWVVGHRNAQGSDKPVQWIQGDSNKMDELLPPGFECDFIFSCPPYGNLEVYSDLPEDISNMNYKEFRIAYATIILRACKRLKNNRFAAFVVANFRDKKTGYYNNFVGDTVRIFEEAGLHYYNEGILLNAIGSLPVRVTRQFDAGRKLGKAHQNVLVFVKGDAKKATEYIKANLDKEDNNGGIR